jgi:hypothetical protein
MTAKPKAATDVKPSFSPRTVVALALEWPMLYPGLVFRFNMRVQLVQDAERVQTEFIMLPDAEQTTDRRHEMDARMIGLLSTQAPEGFADFPELKDGDDLAKAIEEYFTPADPERREGMKFICRGVMARYWKAVTPADYL